MNKRLLTLTCAIGIIALLATSGCTIGGDFNMATITSVTNGETMGVTKGKLNTNFTNINNEVIADTTAIGTLAGLTTTNKTDLVSAINEVGSHADTVIASNALKITSAYGGFYRTGGSFGGLAGSDNAFAKLTVATAVAYPCSNFTYQANGALRCDRAGVYKVDINVTGILKYTSICLFVDNTALSQGVVRLNDGVSSNYMHGGTSIIVSLTLNQVLTIGIKNNVAGSIATYEDYNLVVTSVS